MKRYNPTRRGNIETGGCKCGWSRKRQCWVSNGCKLHPRRGRKRHNPHLSEGLYVSSKLPARASGKFIGRTGCFG